LLEFELRNFEVMRMKGSRRKDIAEAGRAEGRREMGIRATDLWKHFLKWDERWAARAPGKDVWSVISVLNRTASHDGETVLQTGGWAPAGGNAGSVTWAVGKSTMGRFRERSVRGPKMGRP